MNERIKELAHQAELPVIDGEWDYNDREILCQDDGEWRAATPAEIISVLFACEKGREKFAELIVRECIDTLLWHGCDDAVPYIEWMAKNKLNLFLARNKLGVE